MYAKPNAAVGLAAAMLLAGCLVPVPGFVGSTGTSADTATQPTWNADDWWSFQVETTEQAASATYVVHEADADGYHLGSNRSNGFFGIPFHGELAPDLDPRIAGERWDMFRFPLQDGDTWTQRFLGHVVTTDVHATTLEAPDGGTMEGYRLEAEAYGSQVAAYTYAPETGWLVNVTLWNAQAGEPVVWANLTDRGTGYEGRYLVEEPVHELERSYPGDVPGWETLEVDATGSWLVASLTGVTRAGHAQARLEAPDGEVVAAVSSSGRGVDQAEATWPVEEGTWTLEHLGAGAGEVRLGIYVVHAQGAGAGDPGRTEAGPAVGDPVEEPLDHLLAETGLG